MKVKELAHHIEMIQDHLKRLRQQINQVSLSQEIIWQQVFLKLNQTLEYLQIDQKQISNDHNSKQTNEQLEIKFEKYTTQLRNINQQLESEIAERQQAENLLKAQTQVLEMIATGASLADTLNYLAKKIEQQTSVFCSILLVDRDGMKLKYGAAPSLPEEYNRAIDGIAIAPGVGSCGTAAYLGEPVIVSDIATDPLWVDFKDLGLAHGLRSCWSAPILAKNGKVLGTLAMYDRQPRTPGPHQWQIIEVATRLAAIALSSKQAEQELNERSRLAALVTDISVALQQNQELPEILQQCCTVLVKHLNVAFARIWTLNTSDNVLELQASAGIYTHINGNHSRVPVGELKIGRIAQTGQPYLTNDVPEDPHINQEWAQREGMVAFAGYPMILENQVVGVMAMFSCQPLSQNALNRLATIADAIAQCIERKQTEKVLRSTLNRLDLHFANTPLAVIEWDSNFRVSRWSPQAEKIFGWQAEEVFGLRADEWQFVFDEDREKIKQLNVQLRQGNYQTNVVLNRNYRKDGSVVYCQWYNSFLLDESGHLVSILSFILDVSERQQMQQEIERSLSLLTATLEATGEGIIATQNGKYITTVNQKFIKIWGIPESAIASRDLEQVLPFILEQLKDPQDFVWQAQSLFSQPNARGYNVFPLKDGRIIERYSQPQRLGEEIVGRVCCFRDITDRHHAEIALRESETRFRQLAENIDGVFWISNHIKPEMLYISPAYEKIWGRSCQSLYEQPASYLEAIHPDDRPRAAIAVEQELAGQITNEELRIIRPDGSIRWIWDRGFPIKDESGQVYCVCGIAQDITERKQMEETLKIQAKVLESMAEAVILTDEDATILLTNPALDAMFGYEKDDLIGKNVSILNAYPPEQNAQIVAEIIQQLHERGVWKGELHNRRRDGTIFISFAQISSLELKGKKLWIAVQQDVTQRHQMEVALRLSEERFRIASQCTKDLIYEWDMKNDSISWFGDLESQLKYGSEELPRNLAAWKKNLHPQECDRVMAAIERHLQNREPFCEEYRIRSKDGSYLYWTDRGTALWDEQGNPYKWIGAYSDITHRKLAEAALLKSEAKNRAILNSIPDAIFQLDKDGTFLGFKPAKDWRPLLSPSELLGRKLREVMPIETETIELLMQAITQTFQTGDINCVEYQLSEAEQIKYYEARFLVISEEELLAIVRDITERKRTEETILYQANYDQLTGLPNRKQFNERLQVELEKAHCNQSMLAVMFLDLDRFKNINDTLGHAAGDRLLQNMSERVKNCLRTTDMMARWGGDEFTILLPEIHNIEDSAKISQRIIDVLKPAFYLEGHQLHISNSIGIAIYPQDGLDAQTLLRNADAALYRVKEQGRNNYQFYTSIINSQASELLVLENELHQALKREEFVVYYQPQIKISTGEIIGVEALVRWQHPQFGLVPPDKFIPLAEQTGLIIPIGEWVLQTACQQSKAWQDAGLPPIRVAVNLSARQFQQSNLTDMVASILSETGLKPEYLDLEITETLSMKNVDLTKTILTKLYEMGTHLSIDDFGTGYSSLRYLKQFPFHTLKIDGSFVQELTTNSKGIAIIKVIIALGTELNLELLAEGVEIEAQKQLLYQMGCQYMQGYLFSRPLSVKDVTELLKTNFQRFCVYRSNSDCVRE